MGPVSSQAGPNFRWGDEIRSLSFQNVSSILLLQYKLLNFRIPVTDHVQYYMENQTVDQ